MHLTVIVPESLSSWLGGRTEAPCRGTTLGACLDDLERSVPGFRDRVVDERGQLRSSVLVFLNGESVHHLEGLATPVQDGDQAGVIPLAAGG